MLLRLGRFGGLSAEASEAPLSESTFLLWPPSAPCARGLRRYAMSSECVCVCRRLNHTAMMNNMLGKLTDKSINYIFSAGADAVVSLRNARQLINKQAASAGAPRLYQWHAIRTHRSARHTPIEFFRRNLFVSPLSIRRSHKNASVIRQGLQFLLIKIDFGDGDTIKYVQYSLFEFS
jgi:hypothetical protein